MRSGRNSRLDPMALIDLIRFGPITWSPGEYRANTRPESTHQVPLYYSSIMPPIRR